MLFFFTYHKLLLLFSVKFLSLIIIILYKLTFVIRAIPFKYTWEGVNTTYFRPPHQ